jgi:hypothetical protein
MGGFEGDDHALQNRIVQLTSKLEGEVSRVNQSHRSDLENLAFECNNAIKELTLIFDERLRQIQQKHLENISHIQEEIAYLRELSDSQHLMLQNNIDYIKSLEQRYITKPPSEES